MNLHPVRTPINGTFELTVRCNLHCRMCLFRHDDSENSTLIKQERTADEWIDMAHQVAEAGTVGLLITGGEPLFRQDFAKIWEGIYRIGFQLELYTNATLVTPQIMELLRKYPPHRIGISIYGASEETYERVCGSASAYKKAIEGIARLSTLPSLLDFRTTIIQDNLNDVDEMEEWVRKNYGEERTLTHTEMVFKPVRGGCSDAVACRLRPEENIQLYLRRHMQMIERIVGPEKFDATKVQFTMHKNISDEHDDPQLTLFGCDAGMKNYTISWDGKLLGCQVLGVCYTEPFQNGFQSAWDAYPMSIPPIEIDQKCKNCEISGQCLSCLASRFAETGDPGACSKYVCENTRTFTKFITVEREFGNEKILCESGCTF